MPYVSFPTAPKFNSLIRRPLWNTRVQIAVSGAEFRAPFWNEPKLGFTLSYDPLNGRVSPSEYEKLMGFYLLMQGPANAFLFDPLCGAATYGTEGVTIGTGDTSETEFQLIHDWGGYYSEDCARILASPVPRIYLGGVLKATPTHYSINMDTGLVTFVSAPGMGVVVTADFNHQYLVRFAEGGGGAGGSTDGLEFENFLYKLWRLNQVDLIQVSA
jgi:uncharacterized protein (TIGR02217 family)